MKPTRFHSLLAHFIDLSVYDRTMPEQNKPWSWPRFVRNFAIIVVTLVALGFVYDGAIRPNLFAKNFGVVAEGEIYRSGKLTTASLSRVIENRGIQTIVDFGAFHAGSDGDAREQRTADAMGVSRVRLPMFGNGTGDPNNYVAALRIMTDRDAGPVLVHCAAGAQRTGCAVMLYRSIVEGIPPDEAYEEAQQYGHDPDKNPALRAYFMRWHDAIADSLETGEPIPYSESRP